MKFLHFLYFLPTEGKFAKLHLTIVLHKEECKQCSDNGHELSSGSPFFWDTGALFGGSQFSITYLRNLFLSGHRKSGEGHELSSKWWSKVAAGGDCWLIIDTGNRNCRKIGLNIKCILSVELWSFSSMTH